jgi:hypothetical protein
MNIKEALLMVLIILGIIIAVVWLAGETNIFEGGDNALGLVG